jgi:hypothetical protein
MPTGTREAEEGRDSGAGVDLVRGLDRRLGGGGGGGGFAGGPPTLRRRGHEHARRPHRRPRPGQGRHGQPRPPRRRQQSPAPLPPAADPLANLAGRPAGQGHPWRRSRPGPAPRPPAAGWCRRPAGSWPPPRRAPGPPPAGQDPQVDRLAGLDDPGLAGLGLAHGLRVDAGPLPHAGLGQPPGP